VRRRFTTLVTAPGDRIGPPARPLFLSDLTPQGSKLYDGVAHGPATAQPVSLRGRACQSAGRRRDLSAHRPDHESTGSDKIKLFATPRSAFPRRCGIAWDGVDRNLSRRGSGDPLAEMRTSKFSYQSDNLWAELSPRCPCARASQCSMQGTPVSALLPHMASALDDEGVRQCVCVRGDEWGC
jgi:hypothetical protein